MTTKRFYFYLCMLLLLTATTGCKEDFDNPPMIVPRATHTPNTTIAELKAKYWQDGRNFCDTIKEDIVIHGWISGNDASGNLYKVMYIQDETGGIGISLDASSLATNYRVGQEIVLNLKNRWIGKYNGQYLLGYPEWYAAQSVWEAGRMQLQVFEEFCELNGLPVSGKVQPVECSITDFQGKNDTETQLKFSGQLVRISDLTWDGADGTLTFSEPDATTNRTVSDANGNQLTVRNSNYADFHGDPLPVTQGNLTGILVMTGSDQWQLFLRDLDDVDFDMNTKGTKGDPYTVPEFIENQGNGKSRWVTGYIVGAVAPEVTSISDNDDIEWKAPTTLATTLVIAPSPEVTDIAQCIVVPLPQGSKFREQANLVDNPEAYKTQIWVKGTSEKYMGANGVGGNSGTTDEFRMSIATGGLTELTEGFDGGNLPTEWFNVVVSGDKKWYGTDFQGNGYAAMTGYRGTNPPFDAWLVSPALAISKAQHKNLSFRTQVNGYGNKTTIFEVYVMSSNDPTTATLVKLNPTIATAPASGYSDWAQSGELDLSQFDGTYFIGFRFYATQDANYATWCVDDVKFNFTGSDTPEPQPVGTRADFETMNDGEPKSSYGSFTSTAGWTAANCNLLKGGDIDSNPVFKFIGMMDGSTTNYAFAPCLNGKTSATGKVTSPMLTGGIAKLKFNYGMPYGDTHIKMSVDIVQNGNTVKTWTVEQAQPVKYQVYTFEETVGLTGNFQIVFTNLSPTAQDANKDRICIWNVNWENQSARAPRRR